MLDYVVSLGPFLLAKTVDTLLKCILFISFLIFSFLNVAAIYLRIRIYYQKSMKLMMFKATFLINFFHMVYVKRVSK